MLETLRRRNLFAVLALPGTVHQCGTSLALTLSRVGLVVSEHAWWAKSEPKANRDKRNVRESLPLSPFPPPPLPTPLHWSLLAGHLFHLILYWGTFQQAVRWFVLRYRKILEPYVHSRWLLRCRSLENGVVVPCSYHNDRNSCNHEKQRKEKRRQRARNRKERKRENGNTKT